jgi:hypothetical protein
MVFFLYVDSLVFTLTQMTIRYAFDVNSTSQVCSMAVIICLAFYLSTKILIYFYFVERLFLVWSKSNARGFSKRIKDKIWLFNMIVVLGGYAVAVILSCYFRVNELSPNGYCYIGIGDRITIFLTVYEIAINVYLTILFIMPLQSMMKFQRRTKTTSNKLQALCRRCIYGTMITTLSTSANLGALSGLRTEQAWLCLLCCNVDCSLISSNKYA